MTAEVSLDTLWAIALSGTRLVALFASAPLLSHGTVPLRVRAGLALVVAWGVGSQAVGVAAPLGENALEVGAALAREALIGFSLGFAARLVFAGFGLLGEFVSVQGGLGAATVLDPASGVSSVVLSSLLQIVGLALFLVLDGHHLLLRATLHSFRTVPLGGAALEPERFAAVVGLGASIFEVAARLAAPVTAVMLVSNVAVGILGRAIPQLNLMALQLPAQIGLTLLVIGLGAGPLTSAMAGAIQTLNEAAVSAVLGEH